MELMNAKDWDFGEWGGRIVREKCQSHYGAYDLPVALLGSKTALTEWLHPEAHWMPQEPLDSARGADKGAWRLAYQAFCLTNWHANTKPTHKLIECWTRKVTTER